MEICIQLHQVALENVDYQMRKYGMKCGFSEVLSTFVKLLPFLFEQNPKAGSIKDAVCVANLFLSAPCFGSPLQMSGPFFSSPAKLDSKMCLSKFYGDFWLCGEISITDVSGPQQLRTAICSLTQCIFS